MYLSIVFLPLFSAVVSLLGGRWLGGKGVSILTTGCLIINFFMSMVAFYEVALGDSPVYIKLGKWMESTGFSVDWGFQFDTLTVVMLIVVTCISSMVHIYSTSYMEEDPHLPRFMAYLSLFTFFMLILVTGDNLVQLFLGWEGVGLASFLLINFWFTRLQANKAAIKAMLVNRVGDFGLALGIFAIGALFQAVDYATIFAVAPRMTDAYLTFFGMDFHALTLISLLLFVGAVGKSAQVGLHTWLPDAMEGPTPVSALIHAATMVTAGVFLLARCSPLLEFAPDALHVICIFGALTAFLAATTGLAQNDLKRVIAYSTCSQLGYMVFACGLSQYGIAVFHLANHAFFKALLFLGAGSVIHGVGDEQDMRKMGGLRRLLPFTYGMIVIGSLALMGTPFLTGFYSKDAILESAYATHTQGGHFAYYLGSAAAFATAFYSMRLLCLAFLRKTQGSRPRIAGAHEGSPRLLFPLAFLAIPSICIGYIGRDFFVGMGSDAWGTALFTLPGVTMMDGETLPFFTRMLPLFLSFGGAAGAWYLYKEAAKDHHRWILSDLGNSLYTFANRKWFFDRIYNVSMNQNFLVGGYKWTYGGLDRGLLEGLGPSGLSSLAVFGSRQTSNLQTGQVYHSALLMLVGMTILMVTFQGPEWIYSMLNPCWLGIWGSGAVLGAMLSKSK